MLPSQAGTRLDRWLADSLPALSRSRLQSLIQNGAVSSQGTPVSDASRKVRAHEEFSLCLPPPADALPAAQKLALQVVYEDAHLIVIDKPPGLVVHPAPGNPDHTLVNALLHHCAGSLSGIGGVKRPGIVHRIDKDTSGLMVAAKDDATHRGLAAQFAEHSIERAYLALCAGVPLPRAGQIEGAIGRHPVHRQKMAVVASGGKSALTFYSTEKTFGNFASLVQCRLATGRTHQIRVHMTSIGHPLVGDPIYGRPRMKSSMPPDARLILGGFRRQALHARLLGFTHPISLQRLSFSSELPFDFMSLISALEAL